jgi:hypothetical protein
LQTNYVLIDYENVQPKNLGILSGHPFEVFVFVGANQAKVPYDLAEAMQRFGNQARYVKVAGNGKNALDFHLAFYLGELVAREPGACFHVISKDTGFDPLIRHLKKRQVRIRRHSDLGRIPLPGMSAAAGIEQKIAKIIGNLTGRGEAKPKKLGALVNTIHSLFPDSLADAELRLLIEELQKKNYIALNEQIVSYMLPSIS